jgi:hypothetical protein
MTGDEILKRVTNDASDAVKLLLALLDDARAEYCIIGGMAVNAYADPVVSLDLDVVVRSDALPALRESARQSGMRVEEFAHSTNLTPPGSDLRIQFQSDPRYQGFLAHAVRHRVLGHEMPVASLRDVLQGKLWAWSDSTRRASKRQKDLADILRLVELHPELRDVLPQPILALL